MSYFNFSNFDHSDDEDESIYEDIPPIKRVSNNKMRKISSGVYKNEGETLRPKDEMTRIKGCATMWHENSAEMIEMIKSIFR